MNYITQDMGLALAGAPESGELVSSVARSDTLEQRLARELRRPVHPGVQAFAAALARDNGGVAALFYGSNLRSGALEGVLDFYLLLPGKPERGIWPRVSYHEMDFGGHRLRAKVATMTLAKFAQAASGALDDTTIWARFVQARALVWSLDVRAADAVIAALVSASATAARLAAALGPCEAPDEDYWAALFGATYQAELRVEAPGRERTILATDPVHFEGLLPLALDAAGITWSRRNGRIAPAMPEDKRRDVLRWWRRRRRLGKLINVMRLLRAAGTFDGAARYAAWKLERHTGVPVQLTPWQERHPVLAAPLVLWNVWRSRRTGGTRRDAPEQKVVAISSPAPTA